HALATNAKDLGGAAAAAYKAVRVVVRRLLLMHRRKNVATECKGVVVPHTQLLCIETIYLTLDIFTNCWLWIGSDCRAFSIFLHCRRGRRRGCIRWPRIKENRLVVAAAAAAVYATKHVDELTVALAECSKGRNGVDAGHEEPTKY